MRVAFWGVRGSIPTPDVPQARYGGNTPCVQVTCSQRTLISLDGGMGFRWMTEQLMQDQDGRSSEHLHLLLTHCHWDHIQGIPFSPFMYVKGNKVTIYGRPSFEGGLRENLLHQVNPDYCPVPNFFLQPDVGATVEILELGSPQFQIGPVRVTSRELPRGGEHRCSAYRIEDHGASVVYISDVEYPQGRPELAPEAVDLARGADLLIHDAQFLPEEAAHRQNWGHSTFEQALALARMAACRRLALFHHEPRRSDDELDALQERARRQAGEVEVFVACEGMAVDL